MRTNWATLLVLALGGCGGGRTGGSDLARDGDVWVRGDVLAEVEAVVDAVIDVRFDALPGDADPDDHGKGDPSIMNEEDETADVADEQSEVVADTMTPAEATASLDAAEEAVGPSVDTRAELSDASAPDDALALPEHADAEAETSTELLVETPSSDIGAPPEVATDPGPDAPDCSSLATDVLCYVDDWSGNIDEDPLAVFVGLGGKVAEPFVVDNPATLVQAWTKSKCTGEVPSVSFGTETVVGFAYNNACYGCLYLKELNYCSNDRASFLFSSFDNTGCMVSTVGILFVRVPASNYSIEFSTMVEDSPSLRWCSCPPPPDPDQCWHPPESW